MLHDVASPVAASRFYAYSMLGAYEIALLNHGQLPNINAVIKGNLKIQSPVVPKAFNLSFCTNYALLDVGRQIMPSGLLLKEKQKELTEYFVKHKWLSQKNVEENIRYAEDVARQVVQFARTDDYNKLSTYTRYTPNKKEGHWYPTPRNIWGLSSHNGKQ